MILGKESQQAWMPDWYPIMQAAKYLGVPVHEAHRIPKWWIDKAIIAMSAENQARKFLEDRNSK